MSDITTAPVTKPRKSIRKRTPEERERIVHQVCTAVGNGRSTRKAVHEAGLVWQTWWNWLEDKDILERYARARIAQANVLAEQTIAFSKRMAHAAEHPPEHGPRPDAALARVAMDGLRWAAARLHPVGWGDSQRVDVSGQIEHALRPSVSLGRALARDPEAQRLAAALRARIEAVAGGEVVVPAGLIEAGTGEVVAGEDGDQSPE